MKSKVLLPVLVTGLCLSGAALAAGASGQPGGVDDNLIGLTTPNGKLAYDFINLWFNEHKPREAFDRYVSRDNYMNHAVYSASVNQHKTFAQEREEEARATGAPSHRFEIKQLVSQGSLVFAHIHVTIPGQPGNELVMILRVRDGKVTDHWDLHEKLKADSAVFAGLDR